MRQKLLLLLSLLISTIAMAQTTWTGGGANTNWNNIDNWDTNQVPTALDDVVIPTGFTVTLNVIGNVKSIEVQGISTLNINTNLTFNEPSIFRVNATVNWASGTLNGGSILTNNGTINLTTGANHVISGATVVNNQGVINFTSVGDLFVSASGTELNNLISGIIDIQENAANITWTGVSGVINNAGLFKKTTSVGEAQVLVPFNNNDGTIQVEEGTLSFISSPKNFTDGTYNVFEDATLDWDVAINVSGTLGGTLAGNLNWNNTVSVAIGDTAVFNFTEPDNFSWTSGTLNGGGTLTNLGTINLTTGANHVISGATVLNNQGVINLTSAGDLFVSNTGTELNNLATGIIEVQENAANISWTGAAGIINNVGLFKKTTSLGSAQVIVPFNNNDGTIQIEEGALSFTSSPKNFTDGTYNVFADATLDWDVAINVSGTLEGTLAGNLNWNNTVSVAADDIAVFNFTEPDNFSWTSGTLNGGGTLTNLGTINLTTGANHVISGATVLNNQGTINLTSVGDLFISNTGTELNNLATGIIEIQENAANISWTGAAGIINNVGLFKKTTSLGSAQVIVPFNNNDGTIQVEEGALSFISSPKNFTDGTYNVFADATLDWDVAINVSGTLEGTLAGNLNWNNTVSVAADDIAVFNFTEPDNFSWTSGTLNGGGTLTNLGTINLTTGANHTITEDTTLDNQGSINITSAGDLFLSGSGTSLNNSESGIIDLQANFGNITWSGAQGVLNNEGLLKRSTTTGVTQILAVLNNSGTIEVATGELEITGSSPFTNLESGIVKGVGTFDLPTVANYTNNGTFAPGLSPGTLSVQGTYESTSTSVLDIEINGLTPDTEYDVLAITGTSVVFEGTVNVTMGFEGEIGDEFTIATTTGTITTANLQSPIEMVDLDGKRYTFDISYPDDNKVVLTITDKLDILPPNVVTQDITVQLGSTGNVSILPSDIDNGSTDNCSLLNELIFSLDIDSFTCADLGDNIVNLTVTDIEGNSASAPATVTVEDVAVPTVITNDITIQLDGSGSASIVAADVNNGSTDNCGISSLSIDNSTFDCSNVGANTVTLTVTDISGNMNTGEATVTVEDSVLPMVVTQDITIQLDGSGSASTLAADIDDGSTDNCEIASLSLDVSTFDCSNIGDNTVILSVTDSSGNQNTGTATVTVEDNVTPVVVTQDITVQLDAGGNASITTSMIDNGSSDNCGIASLSLDISTFTSSDLGANTVTLTAIDVNGNSSSATAVVTVLAEEDDAPVAITRDITVELDVNGEATITPAMVDNGSTADAGLANLSLDITDFDCSNIGPNTVTLTITDVNNDSDSSTAVVTVVDNITPVVATQDITVQLDAGGNASITASMIDNGSSDNCGIAGLSVDVSTFDCSDLGPNNVTLTVTDVNGNSNTGTATVTVEDNVTPVVVTQDITVQLNGSGNASITASMIDNGSTDNCGIVSLSLDISTFTSSDLGVNTVTLTATDDSGNAGSATAEVTVEENDGTPGTILFQEVFTDNRAALSSSVAFNDVDGDNDQDFIITGSTQRNQFGPSGGQISRLYKNNGTGNFGAPVSGTPFMGLSYSSLSFSDVNQDGIKDVVSAGEDYSTGINYVKYYSSDGTGSFTETTGTPFPPNMKRVDFKIADFDNDGVNDILLIGVASNGNPASPRLFENRGTEMNPDYFNRFSPSPLPRVSKGSIAVADIDGDSDLDIFISGKLRNGNKISRLYRNEGNFQFTEITGTGLDQVDSGDSAFADVDDDGDEDLLISGLDSADNNVLKLYLNDGTGVFTEAIAAINIPSMWLLEAFDFADVDGDTDQDVLLTGYNPANYQRITTMWENLLYSSRRPNTGDTSGFNIDMDDEENDLSFGAGFKLVPNPTGLGFTNIIMPDVSGEVEVIINDVLGRAVSSQSMTITNNRIELDTKDLSSGVYVISLRKGKSTFTTKLIVE